MSSALTRREFSPVSSGPLSGSPCGPRSTVTRVTKARRVLFALCAGATALLGCPLYSDDCDGRNDCASGFYCDQYSQRCAPVLESLSCVRPGQCEVGETCTPDFVCRPGSCDFHGCVNGYQCAVVDSAHTCVPGDDPGPVDASVPPAPADAGADAAAADAGLATDLADAGDAGSDASL
jgi:hypothetical protein